MNDTEFILNVFEIMIQMENKKKIDWNMLFCLVVWYI